MKAIKFKDYKKDMVKIINSSKPVDELRNLGYLSPYQIIEPNLQQKGCSILITKLCSDLKYINDDFNHAMHHLLSKSHVPKSLLNAYSHSIIK